MKSGKRRQTFEQGMQRLYDYIEELLSDDALNDSLVRDEFKSIDVVKTIPTAISLSVEEIEWAYVGPQNPVEENEGDGKITAEPEEEGLIVLAAENYRRYDDVLPESMSFEALPASMDSPKILNAYIATGHKPGDAY